MNKSNWKQFERWVASLFGVERTPLSGGNSKHTRGDIIHETVYAECKKRKSHAIHALYLDTKKKAAKEGKIPAVFTMETGRKTKLITTEVEYMKRIVEEIDGHNV